MEKFGEQKLSSTLQVNEHRKEQAPIKNLMLGEIDPKTGKYIIEQDITNALVNLIKTQDKKLEDNYFVTSFSDFDEFGKLQFVISTEILPDGQRKAVLYLIENVETNGGLTIEANIHPVAEFIDAADIAFEAKMLKHFKVINTAIVKTEDLEDEFEEFILYKKFLAKEVKSIIKDKMEVIEADLLTKRLKLLLEYGEFGLDALTIYETLQAKAKEKLKKGKLTAQELNELLEAALGYAQKKHAELAKKFYAQQKLIIDDFMKKSLQLQKETEKKVKAAGAAAKKAAAAAKKGGGGKSGGGKGGGGGKSGGGGDKGKDKKKNDKKPAAAAIPPIIVIDKMGTKAAGQVETAEQLIAAAETLTAQILKEIGAGESISKIPVPTGNVNVSAENVSVPTGEVKVLTEIQGP